MRVIDDGAADRFPARRKGERDQSAIREDAYNMVDAFV
jgi:hypothetical protein